MLTTETLAPELAARIVAWLKQEVDPTAKELLRLTSHGTDWEGSTDEGFHSNFSLSIKWQRPDGGVDSRNLEGEELQSFWNYVIGGL